jgi:hypothetical protein
VVVVAVLERYLEERQADRVVVVLEIQGTVPAASAVVVVVETVLTQEARAQVVPAEPELL